MSPEVVPLLGAAPLLVVMAASDLRSMVIPNRLILGLIALFVIVAPFYLGMDALLLRIAVAGAVFAVCFAAFVFNVLAGGDVKALSALMLFIPTDALTAYAFTFSASMMAGMLIVLGLRQAFGSPDSRFVSMAVTRGYPMGVSIALSGLLLPFTAML